MEASDFSKAGGKPYSFYRWTWNQTVPSSLGPFDVELQTGPGCPPPDEQMLLAAASLVRDLGKLENQVLDIALSHHRWLLIKSPPILTRKARRILARW